MELEKLGDENLQLNAFKLNQGYFTSFKGKLVDKRTITLHLLTLKIDKLLNFEFDCKLEEKLFKNN